MSSATDEAPVEAAPEAGRPRDRGPGTGPPTRPSRRCPCSAGWSSATGGTRRDGPGPDGRRGRRGGGHLRHLLVQAGTGTGKSWGYLVPAVAAAVRRGRGVTVATSTLALQGQLVRQDLPRLADALEGALGRRPTWQLVKGRNNYVCKHRLAGGSEAEEDPRRCGSSSRPAAAPLHARAAGAPGARVGRADRHRRPRRPRPRRARAGLARGVGDGAGVHGAAVPVRR